MVMCWAGARVRAHHTLSLSRLQQLQQLLQRASSPLPVSPVVWQPLQLRRAACSVSRAISSLSNDRRTPTEQLHAHGSTEPARVSSSGCRRPPDRLQVATAVSWVSAVMGSANTGGNGCMCIWAARTSVPAPSKAQTMGQVMVVNAPPSAHARWASGPGCSL